MPTKYLNLSLLAPLFYPPNQPQVVPQPPESSKLLTRLYQRVIAQDRSTRPIGHTNAKYRPVLQSHRLTLLRPSKPHQNQETPAFKTVRNLQTTARKKSSETTQPATSGAKYRSTLSWNYLKKNHNFLNSREGWKLGRKSLPPPALSAPLKIEKKWQKSWNSEDFWDFFRFFGRLPPLKHVFRRLPSLRYF